MKTLVKINSEIYPKTPYCGAPSVGIYGVFGYIFELMFTKK